MAINGHADVEDGGPGGGPVKVVIAVTDVLSGLNATIGILAAVEARHQHGSWPAHRHRPARFHRPVRRQPDRHLLHHRQAAEAGW